MRDRFLWIGCFVYAALFTWLGSIKYAAHRNLVDFGIFAQTVSSAFGCFCNPIEGSHWAFHFSPILYLVGVAVALIHSPLTLVALQAIAGALVAPPIYAIVRARSDVGRARLAALVTLLYPPLGGLIFGDFHENGFAPAAVAWTLYAFDAGLMAWAVVAALITLSVKEDQAVFLAIGGALGGMALPGHDARPGRRGNCRGEPDRLGRLFCVHSAGVGRGNAGPVAALALLRVERRSTRTWIPAEIAARVGFLLLIFAPLLFLPFRSSMMWLAVAPLAEVLLSRMPTTFTLGTHYAGAWIGYVVAAFGFAARELEPRRARTALFACIALCVLEFAVADPLHPGMNLRRTQARDVALDRFLSAPAGRRERRDARRSVHAFGARRSTRAAVAGITRAPYGGVLRSHRFEFSRFRAPRRIRRRRATPRARASLRTGRTDRRNRALSSRRPMSLAES